MTDYMKNHITLEQWAEFNRIKWGCEAEIIKFQIPNSNAYIESLLFFNKHGKFFLPPLNPFHPTVFYPTPTDKPYRISRQWHQAAELMIHELTKRSGSASLCLPPEITDIRPFLWKGFKVNVKYTYCLKLPYLIEEGSNEMRRKIKKADSAGYYSALTENMHDVYPCLRGTETRKGFSNHLTLADLELARKLLGPENFRSYVCYTKEGEPVSTIVFIVLNDHWAFGWVAGSKSGHLTYGVVQQVHHFSFKDLASLGVRCIDLVGANLPSVSISKSHWGGELVPCYQVRLPVFREILRSGLDWIRYNRTVSNSK